jgi:hypothetical protein
MTEETVPRALPFTSALLEAIKRISDQLLLYVLAGAIIVVGAGVWGPESLRTLVVPLVVLLLAGLVVWTVLQAFRVRAGKAVVLQNVRLGPFTRVVGGVKWGNVRAGSGRGEKVEQNVKLGAGGRVEGGITHGDIDTRER